jgi:hypothetical protein
MESAIERFPDVVEMDGFGGIMTDAAGGSQKDHGGGSFFGEDHGVVAGAAGQTMRLAARAADSFLDLIDEVGIHGHRALAQQRVLPERQAAAPGNFLRLLNEMA